MKSQQNKLWFPFILLMTIFWTSCSKDDPVPELDQEVITKVTLTFTEIDESGSKIGTALKYQASAMEGIALGGNLNIDIISGLQTGKRYLLEITAYNDIADEDITVEIQEAGAEHQLYFLGSAFVGDQSFMNYEYDDEDQNGNPIGLKGIVTVDNSLKSNTGELRLVLRHDSNKEFEEAQNPHWGNFTQAGGESDLDITFEVTF
ncbi:hypothetical protein QWY93_14740 [Echinicola jeungdonensis]|uniref:Type 1 periplasmic binding fold superfamily protein n=1 Tax=Echinicola jeungdonensis TaxID=709343 RepID=A0ABV5J2Z5_9BACT|nr:hypothetical protein [Echinicola jeungdonensis]MDN3670577.1 hypothetical protein [Echinicola jeungdonensis]